jgi:GntR family transcriptional regulator, transcriptional repressor for pyruvate dehydrogenase complex
VSLDDRAKLSHRVHDRLREQIASGKWPQGTRIPTEIELAAEHDVSRPVIREALIRLRSEGFIDSRRGSGSIVLSASGGARHSYGQIQNVADLIATFDFRLAVECDSAALAALRGSPETLGDILAANETFNGDLNEESFGDRDLAFHLAIARATTNNLFETTLSMLHAQILFGMRLTGQFPNDAGTSRSQIVYHEHAAIITAIKERNSRQAFMAMRDHLTRSRHRILGFAVQTDWQPFEFPESAPGQPG